MEVGWGECVVWDCAEEELMNGNCRRVERRRKQGIKVHAHHSSLLLLYQSWQHLINREYTTSTGWRHGQRPC